jgi:hypothetical protein
MAKRQSNSLLVATGVGLVKLPFTFPEIPRYCWSDKSTMVSCAVAAVARAAIIRPGARGEDWPHLKCFVLGV